MLTYMHGWEFDQYCITTENIHSAYIKKSRNNYVPALVIFNIKQKERENFQFLLKYAFCQPSSWWVIQLTSQHTCHFLAETLRENAVLRMQLYNAILQEY